MLINDFYANREILITGATGFLGKSLIEKLLRDSPRIKIVYILLRLKGATSIEQRLTEFKQNKAFDRIRQECPEVLSKLRAIAGDCQELGLAIQPSDLQLLANVSVIFHLAANVKFHVPIRKAIFLNTRGTYELIKIAMKLKDLVAFLYCSTAYCNPFNETVEERVYTMPVDWRKTIQIAETYDDCTLNALFMKYSGHYPNYYAYTKNLSEQIIQEYATKLPLVLFRPSIVMSACREPVSGWLDNMNGPVAPVVGISMGAIPLGFCKSDFKIDCIPVDFVTRCAIVAAYKRALQLLRSESVPNDLEVINCAAGRIFNINMQMGRALYFLAVEKNPMDNCFWYYDEPRSTSSYYYFLLLTIATNIPMALVWDNLMRLLGRKPFLMKITRQAVYLTKTVYFFSIRDYNMINRNMMDLEKSIPDSELATYGILQGMTDADYGAYFEDTLRGLKHFVFNHPMQASRATLRRYKLQNYINKTIKCLSLTLFVRYLWFKLNC